jgi:hypothetical protein
MVDAIVAQLIARPGYRSTVPGTPFATNPSSELAAIFRYS